MLPTTGTNSSGDDHLRLMRQAAQGDPEAFCALRTALSPHLLRFLAAHNGHGSVEDLFQEIVMRLWQVKGEFRGESTVLTFVLGIAANVLREHETARQRSPERPIHLKWCGSIWIGNRWPYSKLKMGKSRKGGSRSFW